MNQDNTSEDNEENPGADFSPKEVELKQSFFEPQQRPRFDIVEAQERTRATLAYCLLSVLGVTLLGVGAFITVSPDGEKSEKDRELITLIWTSEVALVGSALGFYFGSQSKSR